MARQISNEEESGSLSLGGGGVTMPGYAAPTSTPGISYDNTHVTTAGVEYNIGLSQKGMQTLDALGIQFKKQYAAGSVIDANAKTTVQGQQYLVNNPSGEGYHQFVMGVYKQEMEKAISNAPDRETRLLLSNHYKSGSISLFESSLSKEREVGTRCSLATTNKQAEEFLTQTYMNPSMAKQNRVMFEVAISNMKPYLGEKYEAYRTRELDRFWESTAKGDINIDPVNAKKKLESGEYPELTAESRARLSTHADHVINSRIERAYRLQKRQEAEEAKQDNGQMIYARQLLAKGKLSEEKLDGMHFYDKSNREQMRLELFREQKVSGKKLERQKEITEKVNKKESILDYTEDEVSTNYVEAVSSLEATKSNPETGEIVKTTPLEKAALAIERKTSHKIKPFMDDIINGLEHSDASAAYQWAQGLEMALNMNPNVVAGIDNKYKAAASYIASHGVSQGGEMIDLNKVVKQARTNHLVDQVKNYDVIKDVMQADGVTNFNTLVEEMNNVVRKTSRYGDWWRPGMSKFGVPFKPIYDHIPVNVRTQMMADYSKAIVDAYNNNLTGADAKLYAREEVSRLYGVTEASGTSRYIKCPPEKIYPEYTPIQLNRTLLSRVKRIIDENKKAGDTSVTFIDPRNMNKDGIETAKTSNEILPVRIETLIDGKKEVRNVYFDKTGQSGTGRESVEYKLYWKIDEDSELTKVYLKLSTDAIYVPIRF